MTRFVRAPMRLLVLISTVLFFAIPVFGFTVEDSPYLIKTDFGVPNTSWGFGGGQSDQTAAGDFNGDGFDDLAVGQAGYESNRGIVWLYFGSSTGLGDKIPMLGEKVSDDFGYTCVSGNLNNDEYDDLVVTAIYSPSGLTGRVYIFFGKEDFFEVNDDYTHADLVIDAEQSGSRFGGTDKNAIGDFNDDGWPDLALGAYRYNPGGAANTGKTYVFFGSSSKWDSDLNASTDAEATITGSNVSYYAGEAHGTGDVNNDGIDDLIIANWRADLSYIGELAIFYGSSDFSGSYLSSDADLIIRGVVANGYFGGYQDYAVGDIDNDGLNDLVIGKYYDATSLMGNVYIFKGSSGFSEESLLMATDADIDLYDGVYYFGYYLLVDDFTRDGIDDLAITNIFLTQPGMDYNYGGVYIIDSHELDDLEGTKDMAELNTKVIYPNSSYSDDTVRPQFGRVLQTLDSNNNGFTELAIFGPYAGTGVMEIYEFGEESSTNNLSSAKYYNSKKPPVPGTINIPSSSFAEDRVQPVMDVGYYTSNTDYAWDWLHTGYSPYVLKEGGTYKMWFSGYTSISPAMWRIGYATSTDGTSWAKNSGSSCAVSGDGCIFEASGGSYWDKTHVYAPFILDEGGTYKMWYVGNNGTNDRVGYATSADGITWTRGAVNNCVGTTGDGCVMSVGSTGTWDSKYVNYFQIINDSGTYRMWYSGHDGTRWRIGYATSPDGITWTKYAGNNCDGTTGNGCIVDIGDSGNFDDANIFAGPVIIDGSTYKMWYSGHDGIQWRGVGHMTSSDGITWTRYSTEPVLGLSTNYSIDRGHVYMPNIIQDAGTYKMWYSAHDGYSVRPAYATSTDGINWIKYTYVYSYTYSNSVSGVEASVDGGDWYACVASDSDFNSSTEEYECPSLVDLTEGEHTIQTRFTDSAGVLMSGDYIDTATFILDSNAPSHLLLNTKSSGDFKDPGELKITVDKNRFKLYFDTKDTTTGVKQIKVSEREDFKKANWIDYDGDMWINLSKGDGKKRLYIKFKDWAGNTSDVYKQLVKVDTTPPEIAVTKVGASASDFSLYKTFYYNSSNVSLDGETEKGSSLKVYADDVLLNEIDKVIDPEGTWHVGGISLDPGIHTIKLTSKDSVGNQADPYEFTLVIDPTSASFPDVLKDNLSGETLPLQQEPEKVQGDSDVRLEQVYVDGAGTAPVAGSNGYSASTIPEEGMESKNVGSIGTIVVLLVLLAGAGVTAYATLRKRS